MHACSRLIALMLILSLFSACSTAKPPLKTSEIIARQVSTEGSALLGSGGKEQARQEAIDAAVELASEQLRTQNAGASLVSEIKVVDEWQDDAVYHVQILAVLSDKPLCESNYRRKLWQLVFPL